MNTIYLSKIIVLTNIIRTKEKCLVYYQNLSFNTKKKKKVTIIVNNIKTSTKIKVLA